MRFPRPFFSPEGETGAAVETPAAGADAAVDAVAAAPAGGEGIVAAPAEGVVAEAAATGESLLSAAEAKKPEGNEGAVKDAAAVTEAAKEAAPEPVHLEPFTVPEGMALDEKALGEFSGLMSDPDLSPQERGQKLLDMYAGQVKSIADDYAQRQVDVWRAQNDTWKDDLRRDPDLGGNRINTTLGIAKSVIEEYGGSKEQQAELLQHIDINGMGNFAGFVRLLHNIGTAMNVIEDGIVAAPSGKVPAQTRGEKWYGNGKGA